MSRLTTLTLTSHRGRDYPVELFSPDTGFTDTGAVYLYLKLPEGRSRQVQVFYVGETCALDAQLAEDRRPGGPWERAEALGFDAIGGLALAQFILAVARAPLAYYYLAGLVVRVKPSVVRRAANIFLIRPRDLITNSTH